VLESKVQSENYVRKLRENLERIHQGVREHLRIKSSKVKEWYNKGARQISFPEGQKVWFFNPQGGKEKLPSYKGVGRDLISL